LKTKFLCIIPRRYKYVHMEEMLGNVPGCRAVFERWIKWEPDHQGFQSYVNFELR
jgi:crooked neck